MATTVEPGKEKVKKKKKEVIKVILRRLPPYMTWEELKEQLDPLPPHDYVSFCPADLSFAPHAFSRCYFYFYNEQDVIEFNEKFSRYVFVDKKGFDSAAMVELAAYVKAPKKTREDMAKDPRCGIIEQEPDFIRFADELEEKRKISTLTIEEQVNRINSTESSNKNRTIQQTPLTQYLFKLNDNLFKKKEDKRKIQDKFRKPRPEREVRPEREYKAEKEPKEKIRVLQRLPKNGETNRDLDDSTSRMMKKLGVGSSSIDDKPINKPIRSTLKEKETREKPPKNLDKKKDRPEREIYRPGQRSRQKDIKESDGK